MKQIFSLFVGLLFAGTGILYAQTLQVSGFITDADDGTPLIGASVLVKGTTRAVSSDVNGRYSISASADAVLVFSFIGMDAQEIPVSGRALINVALENSAAQLQEVTIVGYGVARPGSQVAAASLVKKEQLQVAVTSFDKALQGNAAGVLSLSNSGQPGAGQQVVIRGISSVSGGTEPLYVVDGTPILTGNYGRTTASGSSSSQNTSLLSNLNTNDIESLTVLKDAAATSIYGSRAANGVVLITTKSGKSGKTQFNLKMETGFSTRTTKNFVMLNQSQYLDFMTEALLNAGYSDATTDVNGRPVLTQIANTFRIRNANKDFYDFDWIKACYSDNAPTKNIDFSATGGTENTKFFVSLSLYDQVGTVIDSWWKRYTGRIKIDHKVNSKISFGLNTALSYARQRNAMTTSSYYASPVFGAMIYAPVDVGMIGPNSYLYNGSDRSFTPIDQGPNIDYLVCYANANFLANSAYDDYSQRTSKAMVNSYAQWSILEGLVLKLVAGGDYTYVNELDWRDPRPKGNSASNGHGLSEQDVREAYTWTETVTLNYMKSFGDHNVNLMLAQEAQEEGYTTLGTTSQDFPPVGGLKYVSSGAVPYGATGDRFNSAVASFFSNLYYNYHNTYYLSASLRTDGSSRLSPAKRWGNFWSVGASWKMANEPFIKNVTFINTLTLRGSYGTSGNSSGIGRYESFGLYGVYDYLGTAAIAPSSPPNDILTWETVAQTNIGLDFLLFKGRLGGTIEWYRKNTTDMILNKQLSRTAGFSSIVSNLGTMYNQGVEIALNAAPVRLKNFVWTVDLNLTHNKNRITALDETGADMISTPFIYRVGEDIQSIYTYRWAGVNPADGRPMYYDNDGEIMYTYNEQGDTRQIVGSAAPKFYGGLSTRFAAFGFDLSLLFSFTYGNKIYDQYWLSSTGMGYRGWWNAHESVDTKRWRKEGDIANYPKAVYNYPTAQYGSACDIVVLDGSYIRLRDINFGYNLPQKWVNAVGISNLRIFTKASNLLTITRFPDADPEVGGGRNAGYSYLGYPNSRTITFGIDLKF